MMVVAGVVGEFSAESKVGLPADVPPTVAKGSKAVAASPATIGPNTMES